MLVRNCAACPPRLACVMSFRAKHAVYSSYSSVNTYVESPRKALERLWQRSYAHIEQVSGYAEIARLKDSVILAESQFQQAQEHLLEARNAYTIEIEERARIHTRMLTHLQHQSAWTPQDAQTYASLHAQHHQATQKEVNAKKSVDGAERALELAYRDLVDRIRDRYHGEQVWSDWIRYWSMMSTLGLVCINGLTMLVAWGYVEPRKRGRIVADVLDGVHRDLDQRDKALVNGLARVEMLVQSTAMSRQVTVAQTETTLDTTMHSKDKNMIDAMSREQLMAASAFMGAFSFWIISRLVG